MLGKYCENIAIYCIILKYRVYRKKTVSLMGDDGEEIIWMEMGKLPKVMIAFGKRAMKG